MQTLRGWRVIFAWVQVANIISRMSFSARRSVSDFRLLQAFTVLHSLHRRWTVLKPHPKACRRKVAPFYGVLLWDQLVFAINYQIWTLPNHCLSYHRVGFYKELLPISRCSCAVGRVWGRHDSVRLYDDTVPEFLFPFLSAVVWRSYSPE